MNHYYSYKIQIVEIINKVKIIMKMKVLPSIGAAVNKPLSLDDIRKSHVADGKTNDIIVMPIAVFI